MSKIKNIFEKFQKEELEELDKLDPDLKHNLMLFPLITNIINYCAINNIDPENLFKIILMTWMSCPDDKIRKPIESYIKQHIDILHDERFIN